MCVLFSVDNRIPILSNVQLPVAIKNPEFPINSQIKINHVYSVLSDTVLTPFIEKSASVARISAAISIHNGIYSKKSIVQEVTAEFLDISPSVAKELLEHDYSSLSTAIQKFHGSLSKIPARVKDGNGLIGIIDLLLDMKKNQEYLKPGKLGDQTAHFSRTTDIMISSASNGSSMLGTTNVETAVESLRKIREMDRQAMKTDEVFKILSDLNDNTALFFRRFKLILDYKNVLKDYLSLKSLTNDLQNVENAAQIAGKYSVTIKKLDPYRQELIAASTDTDKIKESLSDILKYSESVQRLFPTSILNSTAPKYDRKLLTSGLLGYKDLDNVWKDFENPWIEKNFLNNMDPTPLKLGLEGLKLFISSLDTLPSIQKLLDNENEKKTVKDLAKKIREVHELGFKVLNVTNIKSPYEDVSNCIEPLKPIKNPPDQDMLQRIVKFSADVAKKVEVFSELMDHLINNGLNNTKNLATEMFLIVRTVSEEDNKSELIKVWDAVLRFEKDHSLADKLDYIAKKLNTVDVVEQFREDASIDYSVIKRISTVFEDTNVESVLACIKRQSVDNLMEIFGFIHKSDNLINQKTDFTTATNYISNLLKVQKSFQEVITKMKNAMVSKESQALIDSSHFKDIGTNSKVIGRSVAALRALESISRAEKSIKSVVNLDSDAKIAIQKSLGPKSTDALIREMTLAQNSMKEILKVVKTKRIDSVSDIQSTFVTLSQLKNQTDIEDDNFLNLALEMTNQTDPKLLSLAKDLLAISNLDMRFVSHQKSLNVKNSLETMKDMLVNFLKDAERNSSNSNYIVPILIASLVIGLIATAVICLICWYRGFGCWHFVESGDLESGNHGKARKRKFGFRKKGPTESKSKMSKPKDQKKKSEEGKKIEEKKEKSQISQIPKSAEQ
ncbi:unnamed protein product [Caenorhabditis nigoni]